MDELTAGSTAIGRRRILGFITDQPQYWLSRAQVREGLGTRVEEADINWLLKTGMLEAAGVDFLRITERGRAFLAGDLSLV
jgi:hypothetical protein